MGNGHWSSDAQDALNQQYASQTTQQTFHNTAANKISTNMAPDKIVVRESRDSQEHPESLGVVVNLDETGSMDRIPIAMVTQHLTSLLTTMIKHGLPDVQVMFNGIGDHFVDRFPLQVGQFESGTTELNHWLTELNLERCGGGNNGESYALAWLLNRFISMDCVEKRGEKGVMFTIGDEECHPIYRARDITNSTTLKSMLANAEIEEFTAKEVLEEAERNFNVFHIIVNHGDCTKGFGAQLLEGWKKLLGERVIVLEDESSIAEVIATTVAMLHGASLDAITAGFDNAKASAVTTALAKIDIGGIARTGTQDGVIAL